MQDSSYSTLPPQAPNFSPLQGQSRHIALDLLMRKGNMLDPKLTTPEAQHLLEFMHLEHFAPGAMISFQAQSSDTGRLMMILAGEANIRMRGVNAGASTKFSPVDQNSRWFTATEGATLGLLNAFSGLSSRFVAQASTELFVASITRDTLQNMKKNSPGLALRYMEMLLLEMALVALDHERNLQAMNNVARSMQSHIDDESGETKPAPLF
jgi:CRP-like cAMP-binding protein